MRIGVFGGSFNPPHKMHEDIAHSLKKRDLLDKIIFVPTGSEYKYKNNLLPDQNRYDMVKLITDAYDYLDVSDYELKSEVVYTCETLAYFKDLESILKKLAKYKDNIIVTDIEKSSLSSTQIRENFTIQDMSVYLNENVLKYIKDNDLYR